MTDVNKSLTSLAAVREERRELDARERALIETAREAGAGWAAVAVALGLRSRQAAEQRWLRLCGEMARDPTRERDRRRALQIGDARAGPQIERLRAAVRAAHRQVHGPDLLKQTLAAALDAPPGALYDLAKQADADVGPDFEPLREMRAVLRTL